MEDLQSDNLYLNNYSGVLLVLVFILLAVIVYLVINYIKAIRYVKKEQKEGKEKEIMKHDNLFDAEAQSLKNRLEKPNNKSLLV